MKLKSTLIIALLFSVGKLYAQNLVPIKEEMSKISTLIGDWEGTGWYQQGQNERYDFNQVEHIETKLNETILLVEGKGYAGDSLVFNAMAIFSYNSKDKNFRIESHLADGKSTLATGNFNKNGQFEWGFKLERGEIRYTMTFDNNTWNEYGEYSADGNQWYKFMEMYLTKK